MPKKLVDVFDNKGKLLHTYPIQLDGLNYEPSEKEFIETALRAAKDDKLVGDKELGNLKAVIRK